MALLGDISGTPLVSQVLMSRVTGKEIYDTEHLVQSIIDILTTPLGSRVMKRDYGSELFDLIDKPMNRSLLLRLTSATVRALHRWEPRIRITRVTFDIADYQNGVLLMTLEGWYFLQNAPLRLENLSLDFFKSNGYDLSLVGAP